MDIHEIPGTSRGNCEIECLLDEIAMIGRVAGNEEQAFLIREVT